MKPTRTTASARRPAMKTHQIWRLVSDTGLLAEVPEYRSPLRAKPRASPWQRVDQRRTPYAKLLRAVCRHKVQHPDWSYPQSSDWSYLQDHDWSYLQSPDWSYLQLVATPASFHSREWFAPIHRCAFSISKQTKQVPIRRWKSSAEIGRASCRER